MNVVVTVGTADDGKDVSQWIRCACFGETAKARTLWNDAQGAVRHGLNVAAWKVERMASIGKNRERGAGTYQVNGDGQHKQGNGRGNHDLNNDLALRGVRQCFRQQGARR